MHAGVARRGCVRGGIGGGPTAGSGLVRSLGRPVLGSRHLHAHFMRETIAGAGQQDDRAGRDEPSGALGWYRAKVGPMPAPATPMGRFRVRLRRLFYGHRPAAVRFQVGLLALDLGAVA